MHVFVRKSIALLAALLPLLLISQPASAEEVGRVGVDWIGNDIVIDAIEDPDVAGVTCHIAYFDRSIIDRLQQGNWFEDPSNASIDCARTSAVTIGDIEMDGNGEEVFQQRRSIILKSLRVSRIYDAQSNALIYLAHARELNLGSAKMSISVVPLADADVTWTNGAPASANAGPALAR